MRRIARAGGPHGELALDRRDGVLELVVDGVFAMDSGHTGTEQALARLALEVIDGDRLAVTVAGLGLGFTAAEALADSRVTRLDVVELHPPLVRWARAGLVPVAARVLADPRTSVRVADVAVDVPALPAGSVDALLLDVDNGPDFLVHGRNAALYRAGFLGAALRVLSPRGVLAVWSSGPSPRLAATLAGLDAVRHLPLPVRRGRHELEYAVYLAGPGARMG